MNCGYSKQPQLSTVSSPRSPRQVSHFTAGALKPHFLPYFLLKASSLSNIQRYSHCHHHHHVVFIPKIYWRDKLFLSFYSSASLLPKILKTLTKIKLSTTSLVFLESRLVQKRTSIASLCQIFPLAAFWSTQLYPAWGNSMRDPPVLWTVVPPLSIPLLFTEMIFTLDSSKTHILSLKKFSMPQRIPRQTFSISHLIIWWQ